MTDIHIPPEALEAGAEYLYQIDDLGGFWPNISDLTKAIYRDHAHAAFTAMVEAWPGASLHQQDINAQYSYFVLPLPQETQDD